MPQAIKAEEAKTVKDVVEFARSIYQYLELCGCPREDFPEEFEARFQELGRTIREESAACGSNLSMKTALGTRSRMAFRELELWVFGQGVFL